MRTSVWLVCLSVVLFKQAWCFDDDLMAKLEKELEKAQNKKSLADTVASFLDSQEGLMDKAVRAKHDGTATDKRNIKAAMDRLEKEMERAAKKEAKRNTEQSLDELLDEIKNGRQEDEVEKRSFHDKFYTLLGYEKKRSTLADKKSFKRMLLKKTLSDILKDYSGSSSSKRESASESSCVDTRTDCKNLLSYCDVEAYRVKLQDICAKTCKYCRECKDELTESGCKQREHLCNEDGYIDRMRDNCYKTCGYCKPPAPPKCSQTTYGCCWDKETIKQNPDGSNCPSCSDEYRYVCTTFKADCFSQYSPGDFMRSSCPETCNLCNGVCIDNPKYKARCGFWKKDLHWCSDPVHRENMRQLCPKTCQFC